MRVTSTINYNHISGKHHTDTGVEQIHSAQLEPLQCKHCLGNLGHDPNLATPPIATKDQINSEDYLCGSISSLNALEVAWTWS